jgi:signal transduction histidine kinase
MTINEWFLKYANKPLLILGVAISTFSVAFILFTYNSNQDNQYKSLKDMIVMDIALGIQNNYRILIESSLEKSVNNLKMNSAFLCKGKIPLMKFSNQVTNCDNIPKAGYFERIIKFSNFADDEYAAYFYAPKYFVRKSHIWFLSFIVFGILYFLYIIRSIREKFHKDIITPLNDDFLSNENLLIKEFDGFRANLVEIQSLKEAQAAEKAKRESEQSFCHNTSTSLRLLMSFREKLKEQKLDEHEFNLVNNAILKLNKIAKAVSTTPYKSKQNINSNIEVPTKYEGEIYCNINELLFEVIEAKTALFDSEGSRVKIIYKEVLEKNPICKVNPVEFGSIVSNIIINAIEAGSTEIVIKHMASVTSSIEISDNGAGIKEKNWDAIFEKDFSDGKDNGTGFGLYHARKYLRKWGGDITLRDSAKSGTIFRVYIPLFKVPEVTLSPNTSVLIMEDSSVERDLLVGTLRLQGLKNEFIHIFKNSMELDNFLDKIDKTENFLLFADNNVGENCLRGIDLIKNRRLQNKSFLVTDSYMDEKIVEDCELSHISLIPKNLISSINLTFT